MKASLTYRRHPRAQSGQGMIEVLVALVVTSFGALGVAGLQGTSTKTVHETQQRLIATFLANDMLERIRNNPTALTSYAGSNIGGASIANEPSPSCTASASCTPAQRAAHDRWMWERSLDGANIRNGTVNVGGLINPSGCVINDSGRVQVVIAWLGAERTSDGGAGANGVANCGSAADNRHQVVINAFVG